MKDAKEQNLRTRKMRKGPTAAKHLFAEADAQIGVEWEPCQQWLRTMGMRIFRPELAESPLGWAISESARTGNAA
jgi:hypothetical protein